MKARIHQKSITQTALLLGCILILACRGVLAQPLLVWPGDANNNGLVNNIDFLHLGLAYNAVGPTRLFPSQAFGAQLSPPWNQTFANGSNYAYADCNGDGIISYNYDAFSIYVYYGLQHGNLTPDPYLSGVPDIDPPLFFDISQNDTIVVQTGDTITLPIHLGTNTLPVYDFYGIAFSLSVDQQWVDLDSSTLDIAPFGTWVNNDNDRITSLYRINAERTDIGLVRTDHNERSGSGKIGSFDFIVIGDVIFTRQAFDIKIDSIYLTDREGNITAVEGDTVHFVIDNATARTPDGPNTGSYMQVYPNPANEMLRVESAEMIRNVQLLDLTGRILFHRNVAARTMECALPALPDGIYLLEIQTDRGVVARKIQIAQHDD